MKFHKTPLSGVILVEPTVHRDSRGFFKETYHQPRFEAAGIGLPFVQDNLSESARGTLRGLHYQIEHPQGKLVQAVYGEVFDVAVDVRAGSPTFGQWYGATLSADNHRLLYVAPGFAHGFCVTSERAQVAYKCTDIYFPKGERSVRWDDPQVGIDWPVAEPILSDKDRAAPSLADLGPDDLFPYRD